MTHIRQIGADGLPPKRGSALERPQRPGRCARRCAVQGIQAPSNLRTGVSRRSPFVPIPPPRTTSAGSVPPAGRDLQPRRSCGPDGSARGRAPLGARQHVRQPPESRERLSKPEKSLVRVILRRVERPRLSPLLPTVKEEKWLDSERSGGWSRAG